MEIVIIILVLLAAFHSFLFWRMGREVDQMTKYFLLQTELAEQHQLAIFAFLKHLDVDMHREMDDSITLVKKNKGRGRPKKK